MLIVIVSNNNNNFCCWERWFILLLLLLLYDDDDVVVVGWLMMIVLRNTWFSPSVRAGGLRKGILLLSDLYIVVKPQKCQEMGTLIARLCMENRCK